jgi:hypothetical protein
VLSSWLRSVSRSGEKVNVFNQYRILAKDRFLELEDLERLARSPQGTGDGARPVSTAIRPTKHKHVRPLSVYQEQLRLFTEEGYA